MADRERKPRQSGARRAREGQFPLRPSRTGFYWVHDSKHDVGPTIMRYQPPNPGHLPPDEQGDWLGTGRSYSHKFFSHYAVWVGPIRPPRGMRT